MQVFLQSLTQKNKLNISIPSILRYPDNPTFMPKRFTAAKQASVSFVQKAKNGNSFNGVDLFLDDYNLSLHRYSEYLPLI